MAQVKSDLKAMLEYIADFQKMPFILFQKMTFILPILLEACKTKF